MRLDKLVWSDDEATLKEQHRSGELAASAVIEEPPGQQLPEPRRKHADAAGCSLRHLTQVVRPT